MAKIKSSSLFVPNPSQYVKAALGSVGTLAVTHGCLSHDIQVCCPECLSQIYMYVIRVICWFTSSLLLFKIVYYIIK